MVNGSIDEEISLLRGPNSPEISTDTIGKVLENQCMRFRDRTALILPWQYTRLTFQNLSDRSKLAAQSLIALGIEQGECVGVLAGNCYQYIEVFLACGRIGCPMVTINNMYSPAELKKAIHLTSELNGAFQNLVLNLTNVQTAKCSSLLFLLALRIMLHTCRLC